MQALAIWEQDPWDIIVLGACFFFFLTMSVVVVVVVINSTRRKSQGQPQDPSKPQ